VRREEEWFIAIRPGGDCPGSEGRPDEADRDVGLLLAADLLGVYRRESITLGVGEEGEVRSQLLRDPDGNGFTMRGGGFIMGLGLEQAELAPSGARWSDPGLPQESVEMKSGARGAFAWSG
jgi:hypothetical protein